jgi:acyl carrier protein
MTLQEVYAAVSPLAEQVLQIPKFDGTLTMLSTPSWDSLRHIQLLSAMERKVGIEIGGDDAFKLTSADKLVRYVHARLEREVQA